MLAISLKLLYFTGFLGSLGAVEWENLGLPDFYAKYLNDTNRLNKELFQTREYDRFLSPVYARMPQNWTDSPWPRSTVLWFLGYLKLLNVDAMSQTWAISVIFYEQWQDLRLIWDPNDYGDVEYLWVNPQKIWLPEHDVGNARALDQIFDPDEQVVKLWYNGSATLLIQYYAELMCAIDVSEFPFDRQSCQIPIKATSYDRNQVAMLGAVNTDFPPETASNGEWNVKKVTTEMEVLGGKNMMFDQLSFVVELHRVPHFYIYVIALPCFTLTFLSIVGMFWSANDEEAQLEKLSIGLTSLVSMMVLLQMVSDAIPKTKQFPLLGVFVIIDLLLIGTGCVVLVAFTTKTRPKSEAKPKNR